MAPKRRRFAVLLGSLLFAASILSVPALATEEGGLVPYTENGDNGAIVFPTKSRAAHPNAGTDSHTYAGSYPHAHTCAHP